MKTSIDVQIGDFSHKQESTLNNDDLQIRLHIKQNQITAINEKLQNILKLKKTPFFTMIQPNHEQLMTPIQILQSVISMSSSGQKIGDKIYHYGQLSNKKLQLLMKKLEKVFHLLTASTKNQIILHLKFQNIEKWLSLQSQQQNLINLFNKVHISGTVTIEDTTVHTFKQVVAKISPQFMQSPIMAFIEVFQMCELNLKLQDLNYLNKETQNQLCKSYKYEVKPNDSALIKMIDKNSIEESILYFTIQKLLSLQIKGSSRLIGIFLGIVNPK